MTIKPEEKQEIDNQFKAFYRRWHEGKSPPYNLPCVPTAPAPTDLTDLDSYERHRVEYPPNLVQWYETVIDVWWRNPQPVELPLLWQKGDQRYWVEEVDGNIVRLVKLSSRRLKERKPPKRRRKRKRRSQNPQKDVLVWPPPITSS